MITPPKNQNTKPTATKNNTQNHKEYPKQRKNRKMTEQIIPQEEIDKSEHRKTSDSEINHVKTTKCSSLNLKY